MCKRSAIEILLENNKSPVSQMRGKHLPVGVEIFEQTYGLILFG
jgi:hypothetical protein